MEVCKQRDLNVMVRHNLVRVDTGKRLAYFENLDRPNDPLLEVKYDMLHVTPPMSAPKFLKSLANETSNGFVAVDPKTLQHIKYENIFALGDCSSLPTSKTAAAIASQNSILAKNLLQLIEHNDNDHNDGSKINFKATYDGYTSCPIVTGNNRCIMAEFDYQLEPLETFPFDQSKERTIMFYMKKDILPFVYWNGMLKGYWSGPSIYRKLMHFGFK
ncbi:sulfide:quinone oxidoreductase, mitochondrial-like protein [Euroglyphus maynei]|uniref:Sulfide:quinone oxidoreductase, mitochondrial-like protein n=1 Tax=Euroglyphus maynei TaxID=6958 RepID=A0A1Y3AXN4_EURMA|nr:sulfide:quinone oxidoreductase, mitochondrial-like protein [Euroglyphus maynei]